MKENMENPFTTAINRSIKNGVFSEYLKRKSTEIHNMVFGEYDYETDIRVHVEKFLRMVLLFRRKLGKHFHL